MPDRARVLTIISPLAAESPAMYMAMVRTGLSRAWATPILKKAGGASTDSAWPPQTISGTGRPTSSRYSGNPQLAFARARGDGFSLKVMWYMWGSTRAAANDISSSARQLPSLIAMVMVASGCEVSANQASSPLVPPKTENRITPPKTRRATTFTRESKAMASTSP